MRFDEATACVAPMTGEEVNEIVSNSVMVLNVWVEPQAQRTGSILPLDQSFLEAM